jgi:23S rRNA (cytidine1920-2'-O)/16S rRNA (cytidine1409-2'-O)-methyltransferase
VESRGQARDQIDAGRVLVAGALADRAARMVAPGEPVHLLGPGPRFVSRSGDKPAAALDTFGVEVSGRIALDAGASTGGFTDCLLQYGAARVLAVDVGHGLMHPRIGGDPRVVMLERTNIRELSPENLDPLIGGPVGLLVADLSFISLRTVAPALIGLTSRGADLVLLVKPQFEAGRAEVSRGRGVIRDPEVRERTLAQVLEVYEGLGAVSRGTIASPVAGTKGNVEFLVHLVGDVGTSAAAPPV